MNQILKILVGIIILYTGLWFFKSKQIEKNFLNASQNTNGTVLVEEVLVSGFPFSQEVSIKNLTLDLEDDGIIEIPDAKISSNTLSKEFSLQLNKPTKWRDPQTNKTYIIKNSKDTQANVSIGISGKIKKIDLRSSGYQVFDEEGNIVTTVKMNDFFASYYKKDNTHHFKTSNKAIEILDNKNVPALKSGSSFIVANWDFRENEHLKAQYSTSVKNLKHPNIDATVKELHNINILRATKENVSNFLSILEGNFESSGIILMNFNNDQINYLDAKLNYLTLSNKQHSISINGSVRMDSSKNSLPLVQSQIKLDNFDLISFKIKSLADMLSEKEFTKKENEDFIKNVRTLKDIGKRNPLSKGNSLVFDIKVDDKGATVNNIEPFELLMLFAPKK